MPYSPSGLWIPESLPSKKFTSRDVKKNARKYLYGTGAFDSPGFRYSTIEHWRAHSRGRIDVLPDVFTKIAVLRSHGKITDSQPVTSTGAVYQDYRGAPEYHQRAHRFFCNPWIGVFTLPDLAFTVSGKLWWEMCTPLAATDIVPNFVNSGDSATEKRMYRPVTEAVREVILEQNPGKPVNPKLIEHVVSFRLIPSYQDALAQALASVREKSDEWYEGITDGEFFSDGMVKAMNQESIATKYNPAKPTDFLSSIEDYLWISARDAGNYRPAGVLYKNLESEIARLSALAAAEYSSGARKR